MSEGQRLHPVPEQLLDFAQGRLPAEVMAEVERHIASCDSCCRQLETAPEDTLIHLAREAATLSFRADMKAGRSRQAPADIPAELIDHPRYRVLGLIGSGGMGAVYKAQHRLMERLVALKVISPGFLQNDAAIERFRREFRAVARLSHPNIVTAFDAEQAGKLHFLVMEFVEGLSLDQLVAQRGPLPAGQACSLIHQAALGLAHIHEKGMVHRDIKPHNLMVSRQGKLKILDCGLARLAIEPRADARTGNPAALAGETQAGMVLGTPDYMAPEQSVDAASADIRSDIYSLGCTMYFALTGHPVFPQGSAVEKLLAHAQRDPAPIESLRPDLPPELARILRHMLAKDPRQRYQSPATLAAELAPLVDAEPTAKALPAPVVEDPWADLPSLPATLAGQLPSVRPATGPVAKAHRSQRFTLPIILVAALLASLLTAIPLCVWLLGNPQPAAPSPAAPARLPRRVLVVIPRWGLWLADYADVKDALESRHIDVVTASSELETSVLTDKSRPGVATPDVRIDSSIRAGDFGAIVFVGLATEEYHPGAVSGQATGRLLADFQREKRLVAAICGGQKALAAHGLLAGKRVARSDYAGEAYDAAGADVWETRVERDGLILTAAADADAAAFAAAIAAALEE